MSKQTCGDCANAEFSLTPTGRIRRGTVGSCSKDRQLHQQFVTTPVAPCLIVPSASIRRIWPDYDATRCPGYVKK